MHIVEARHLGVVLEGVVSLSLSIEICAIFWILGLSIFSSRFSDQLPSSSCSNCRASGDIVAIVLLVQFPLVVVAGRVPGSDVGVSGLGGCCPVRSFSLGFLLFPLLY